MPKKKASVTCPSCGRENGLGVVFCAGCGRHLPPEGITAQQLDQWQASDLKKRRIRRRILDLVLLGLVVLLVLAGWPFGGNIGTMGDDAAGSRLHRQLESLARARAGGLVRHGEVAQTLSEAGINAYLGMIDRREYSIRLEAEGFVALFRGTWWRPSFLPESAHPVLRVEATYEVAGGDVRFAGAKIGKIAIPAGIAARVDRFFRDSLDEIGAWRRMVPVAVREITSDNITLALLPEA